MHVKRHLSRLFGSFRLKAKAAGHTVISEDEDEGKENKMSRSKSLREKVSEQLSTISSREKNKTSSRWQLLDTEAEANPDPESGEVNWLSPTHSLQAATQLTRNRGRDRDSSDNLLNGQLEVPVLVEVLQPPKTPTTTTTPMEDDWSLRVHSATRSGYKGCEEESRTSERVLLDSYFGYEYISDSTTSTTTTDRNTVSRNSPSGIPTAATLTKGNEEDCSNYEEENGHGHQDDDYLKNREMFYELQKSADKNEKKSSKLYRYASFRFRSFNKKNKKIGRSLSLRSITMPSEEIKSIDSKTRNRRVKLQKVKQHEALDIIKPCDTNVWETGNSLGIRASSNPTDIQHHYQIQNEMGKGFRKNIQRKLSIKVFGGSCQEPRINLENFVPTGNLRGYNDSKRETQNALKKSGSGMGKMLKGGFAAMARTMIHTAAVTPIPYECPPSSASYDSYWGNDYHDYNTYNDYHYQLEYNRMRYSNTFNNSPFFQKKMNHYH